LHFLADDPAIVLFYEGHDLVHLGIVELYDEFLFDGLLDELGGLKGGRRR
jgi:hypothetical protein